MTFFYRIHIFLAFLTLFQVTGKAQNAAIGYWDAHLPYNTAVGVATDGHTIFTICNQAFFSYNVNDTTPVKYSKVSGMSAIGMQCAGYDQLTNTLVLVYTSGVIDLFKNNEFYNIPDLTFIKKPEIRKVYQVYAEDGFAYLSTTYGVVVIDLDKQEIARTFKFQINNETVPVYSFTGAGNYFFAVTPAGLYKGQKNDAMLQNTAAWNKLATKDTFSSIVNVNDVLFLSNKKKVYAIIGDSVQAVYTAPRNIQHISAGRDNLLVGVSDKSGGAVKIMNTSFGIIDSFICSDSTVQAVQLADNSIWVAAPKQGLKKRDGQNTVPVTPAGPSSSYAFDILAHNKSLYIAHGGYNGSSFAFGSLDGFSNLQDGKWTLYKNLKYPPINGIADISSLEIDEFTGTLYAGSYLNGLFLLNSDSSYSTVNQGSLFDGSIAYGDGYHQVLDMDMDKEGNLWVSLIYARHQLYVKTREGNWYKYAMPGIKNNGGPIVVDDSGLVWMATSFGNGLAVYDTKNTLSDSTDDVGYTFFKGENSGNLPSNWVFCIAKDKKNEIWAGTDNGIAVFKKCVDTAINPAYCNAEIPMVHFDQYSGPLFGGENVRAIAVDGANRKWIGTQVSGLWLLSEDGQEVIHHFTADNSPLPSDFIRTISIDDVTGDVYVGTDMGVVSYRGTATEGTPTNEQILVYPNPVPAGYSGTIAIRGVVNNADVRITDIAGHLVYRAKALGGQMVWDGKDYTGHRPQSGVYLFFVSDNDGRQTHTGKIVFVQ